MTPASLTRHVLRLRLPKRIGRAARLASIYRQRRHLAELTDEQLRDIGVTRWEADREARRWF